MPSLTVPSVDQSLVPDWTEQDINLYQKMPYFLVEKQIKRRKEVAVFPKVTGRVKWQPNQGPIMRSVRKEPSPHLRSFAFPKEIHEQPLRDVLQVRDVKSDAVVRWQDFETLPFSFVPDFRDFMKNHVSAAADDINDKILRFNDVFIRSQIFHRAPRVVLPGAADMLVNAPIGDGNVAQTAANSKNLDWLAGVLPTITVDGLDLKTLANVVNIASEDEDIPFFSGENNEGDTAQGKYRLILSAEAKRMWNFDPYLLANKNLSLDVVGGKFSNTPFGDTEAVKERHPIRFALAQNGTVTVPAPQTQELNPDAPNYGETLPNPAYVAAQFEVAFLCGAGGYDSIQVGMPPSTFTGGYEPANFAKMKWNGEVQITKNISVPVADANGEIVRWDTNKYGRHLQLIATMACGVSAFQPRYIIPIIFKRKRRVV